MNFLVRTIAIAQNAILPSHWKPKKLQKSTILYDITVLLCFIFIALFFMIKCHFIYAVSTNSSTVPCLKAIMRFLLLATLFSYLILPLYENAVFAQQIQLKTSCL